MAFVRQNTQDVIGRRAYAVRGMMGGLAGPEPLTMYDQGGRVRTLNLGTIQLDDPLDIILPPIDLSNVPITLLSPPQQVAVPLISWSEWFRDDSIVPKVPNWALAGLGGMLVLAMTMPGGGKRRR